MRQASQLALLVGLASLAVGIYSRWTLLPVVRIQAHAFLEFTQVCFLFAIAARLAECNTK